LNRTCKAYDGKDNDVQYYSRNIFLCQILPGPAEEKHTIDKTTIRMNAKVCYLDCRPITQKRRAMVRALSKLWSSEFKNANEHFLCSADLVNAAKQSKPAGQTIPTTPTKITPCKCLNHARWWSSWRSRAEVRSVLCAGPCTTKHIPVGTWRACVSRRILGWRYSPAWTSCRGSCGMI
jgi:hypothetical protein